MDGTTDSSRPFRTFGSIPRPSAYTTGRSSSRASRGVLTAQRRRRGVPAGHGGTPDAALLPGILLITIASGVAYTALRLFTDMSSGIFERFHSMPIARSSVLWAHVLTSPVANLISLVLVVCVALLMGFRSGADLLAWLAAAGILLLFTLALTWIAMLAGLSAKSAEGGGAFAYPLIFLPFLSSAFVPTNTMPTSVRWFAENQPVTSIVNTLRALFTQQPVGTGIWIALAWCVGILIIAYLVATAAYRHRIS
ncbi:ABC transporter permease [Prauserella shujinwangii]|nr:ABC transporter permease [Prauserella shujinwangii]